MDFFVWAIVCAENIFSILDRTKQCTSTYSKTEPETMVEMPLELDRVPYEEMKHKNS